MKIKIELRPDEVDQAIRYYIRSLPGVTVPRDGDVTITFLGRQIEPHATYEVEIE